MGLKRQWRKLRQCRAADNAVAPSELAARRAAELDRAKAVLAAHYPGFTDWQRIYEGVEQAYFPIFLKYPVYPQPRFGYDKPPHPQLQAQFSAKREEYRQTLSEFMALRSSLLAIPHHADDAARTPRWVQPWFSHLDGVALYSLLALRKPSLYIEIGSGNSTKFARQAIADHGLRTRIISIDPQPRAEIDDLADEVVRSPLESVDLAIFDRLSAGDILFFDGSHRSFMNSDVTVFLLEVLPKMPAGLLWQIHDIYLPEDYPPDRAGHYESEQYLIAAMLLADCRAHRVVMPCRFAAIDPSLQAGMQDFWEELGATIPARACSLWMEKLT